MFWFTQRQQRKKTRGQTTINHLWNEHNNIIWWKQWSKELITGRVRINGSNEDFRHINYTWCTRILVRCRKNVSAPFGSHWLRSNRAKLHWGKPLLYLSHTVDRNRVEIYESLILSLCCVCILWNSSWHENPFALGRGRLNRDALCTCNNPLNNRFSHLLLLSDLQFPIDLTGVAKDHPFLEKDPLQSLYRRLVALNRCAAMRLDGQHKRNTNVSQSIKSVRVERSV